MDDAIGHAEAMLGLDGFLVLDVDRKPAEMTITVETTADVVGCPTCGVPRRRTGFAVRHPGPAVLRSHGAAGLAEAPVAVRRDRLPGEDLDGRIQPRGSPSGAHAAGWGRARPGRRAGRPPSRLPAAGLHRLRRCCSTNRFGDRNLQLEM